MLKKKQLKEVEGYDKVYVHEDLTPMRSKMLKFIKDNSDSLGLGSTWTSEGKIFAQPKYPRGLAREQRPRAHVIESPDDFYKIGVNPPPFKALELEEYLFLPRN